MGRFLFDIPEDWTIQSTQASSIHIVGLDGIPWPCKVNLDGQTLTIQRNRDESGRVYIAYPFTEFGEMVVPTGTLPECPEPYCLLTELARGTVNRLRNQISTWQEGGLEISDEVHQTTSEAIKFVGSAIMGADKLQRVAMARSALDTAMKAIFMLSREFGGQIAPVRKSQESSSKFWLANEAGNGEQFQASVDAEFASLIQVPTERAKTLDGLPTKSTILGPLLNAAPYGMSERLLALDDFPARKSAALATTREVLSEAPDSVRLVHAICGLNGTGHRNLSYPQQLQMAVELIQAIEDSPVNAPVLISFDFPWAERLAWSVGGTHPLQIADSLLRRGVRISMLGLEINMDYWPNGSVVRDPFQWIELIDIWSQFGLPLALSLRTPTGNISIADPEETRITSTNMPRMSMSDDQRLEFLDTVLPMMIARPAVHGIIWRQWHDEDDVQFPNAGLVDVENKPKAMLEFWNRIRAELG